MWLGAPRRDLLLARERRRHVSSSSGRVSMRAKPWEVPDGLRLRDDGLAQAAHLAAGRECGKLHELLLAELHAADQLKWERAVADSSYLQAKKGVQKRVPARSIAAETAASTTSS